MDMNSEEVKKAVQNKKQPSVNKKVKSAEKKKEKKNCTEPEVLIDSQKGSVLKVCSGQNIAEWKSLTLLGKLALSNATNKLQP